MPPPKLRRRIKSASKVGRPSGQVLFMQDKKRFEAVFWVCLQAACGFSKYKAAHVCTALLHHPRPFDVNFDHTEKRVQISVDYSSWTNRPEYLVRTLDRLLNESVKIEESREWTLRSFLLLCRFLCDLDEGASHSLVQQGLYDLGWKPFLEIFHRLHLALMGPRKYTTPLPAIVSRLNRKIDRQNSLLKSAA